MACYEETMIIPVWKPLGTSTHRLAQKIGEDRGEKTTHTGTLDPMAEGVVVVLTGEDRWKKAELADTKKIYEFSLIFGVETDSADLLGKQIVVQPNLPELTQIRVMLTDSFPNFLGKQTQEQHPFSSQRVGGKSAFDLAKNGLEFPLKNNEITIHSLELREMDTITPEELWQHCVQTIALVEGNFRQQEVLEQWRSTLQAWRGAAQLPRATITATVSRRTYIRSLARDLSQKIHLPATVFSLVRIQNGEWTKEHCSL